MLKSQRIGDKRRRRRLKVRGKRLHQAQTKVFIGKTVAAIKSGRQSTLKKVSALVVSEKQEEPLT